MEFHEAVKGYGFTNEEKGRLWPFKKKTLNGDTLSKLFKDALFEKSGSTETFTATLDNWRNSGTPQVLCIQGEVGTGKTTMMLAMTEFLHAEASPKLNLGKITNNLNLSNITNGLNLGKIRNKSIETESPKPTLLSVFFCQRDDTRRNSAVAVVKGLLEQLIRQCKDLKPPIDISDLNKRKIPQGPNAFYMLRTALGKIMRHKSVGKIYLLVDALDECRELQQLLDTIADQSSKEDETFKANWLVTTTKPDSDALKWPKFIIDSTFIIDSSRIANEISEPVLLEIKANLPESALATLSQQAAGQPSCLMADLITKIDIKLPQPSNLTIFGSGLELSYKILSQEIETRIMKRSGSQLSSKATLSQEVEEFLCWTTISYRPLSLEELDALMEHRDFYPGTEGLKLLIVMCEPLLFIYDNTVYFRHRSARDYIGFNGMGSFLAPFTLKNGGLAGGHWRSMLRCLELVKIGVPKDISDSNPYGARSITGRGVIYAWCYWIEHLVAVLKNQDGTEVDLSEKQKVFFSDGGELQQFLQANILRWVATESEGGMESILQLTKLSSTLVSISMQVILPAYILT
jgi:hypothetical protein